MSLSSTEMSQIDSKIDSTLSEASIIAQSGFSILFNPLGLSRRNVSISAIIEFYLATITLSTWLGEFRYCLEM